MYLNSHMNAQIALMVNSGHAWGPVMVVIKLNPSQTYVPEVVEAAYASQIKFTFSIGTPA
jgi:hypothetical protein